MTFQGHILNEVELSLKKSQARVTSFFFLNKIKVT